MNDETVRGGRKLNTLLMLGMFIFFTAWWFIAQVILKGESSQSNLAWSVNYQILAIVGAYFGFFVARRASSTNIPRNSLRLFALGLVMQALGQSVYALYITVLKIDDPYISLADVFFLLTSPFYIAAIVSLFYFLYKKNLLFIFSSVLFWAVVAGLEILAITSSGYVFEHSLVGLMDIAYVVLGAAFSALAFGALVVSKGFKNQQYRLGYWFLVFGLLTQCFADLYFIIATESNAWYVGSLADYIYALSYTLIGFGLVQFAVSFVAVNLIVIVLNSFLFIQALLSDARDKFISNSIIFVVSFVLSLLLLRRHHAEEDIMEKNARIAALEETNTKLKALDMQKSEFLELAAHHLRTPLSVVGGYLDLIKQNAYGKIGKELRGVVDNMEQNNTQLANLIDEFLDITSIEQNKISYKMVPFDLALEIAGAVKELQLKADKKDIHIVWEGAEKAIINGDAPKIRHAFNNILDNAIKYSSKGKIFVELNKEGKGWALRVTDSGPGFSAEDGASLFSKFYRGKNVEKDDVTGTGLGLYVCKKYIEAHKGHVWAKSEGAGKGSEFGFWIPK